MRALLISGSTRAASTNTAVLRTAAAIAPAPIKATLYDGLSRLPAFNPDATPDDAGPAVAALRTAIADADGVVFCTPEYAGTLPGSLKNALDWLVGSGELYGKPVGWINAANAARGHGAQATLELVLAYVGAVPVSSACIELPDASQFVENGQVVDPAMRVALVDALVSFGSLGDLLD